MLTLAHALETHKTLSGDDVVAVLEHTEGPFVDGRVYADPALIQELEAYHAGAATAHIEHSPVPIALPVATHRVRLPQAVATTVNGTSATARRTARTRSRRSPIRWPGPDARACPRTGPGRR